MAKAVSRKILDAKIVAAWRVLPPANRERKIAQLAAKFNVPYSRVFEALQKAGLM